jgi:hypothetical protein
MMRVLEQKVDGDEEWGKEDIYWKGTGIACVGRPIEVLHGCVGGLVIFSHARVAP